MLEHEDEQRDWQRGGKMWQAVSQKYMDMDTKTIIDDEISLKPRKAREIGREAGQKWHPVQNT